MSANRPPTRHKDKTKPPVFDVLLSLVCGRLEKAYLLRVRTMRVAHVLGVRTMRVPCIESSHHASLVLFRLPAWELSMVRTMRAYLPLGADPCEFGRKGGSSHHASPWTPPTNFWGGSGQPLNPNLRHP